jgi:hypothetical protein
MGQRFSHMGLRRFADDRVNEVLLHWLAIGDAAFAFDPCTAAA